MYLKSTMKNKLLILLALVVTLSLAACGHQDEFLMRDPQTGEEVTCYSGTYWFDEGMPQLRVATSCIQACENHGFRRFTGNPYADAPHPQSPPPDLLSEIPQQCQP